MNPTSSHGQNNNGQSTFFSQKTEKLATAVYMITDIIDSREPLRWRVREEAMEVLSLMSAPVGDSASRLNVLYRTTQAIERIIQVLTLARNTKLISDMNVTIVTKEYSDLKERVSASWAEGVEDNTPKLNHQFFKVESLPVPTSIPKSFPQSEVKRTSSTITSSIGHNVYKTAEISTPSVTDIVKDTPVQEGKNDRRSIILSLLKTKQEISVSDAMKQFPGVSDKTVQRELVAMVEAGILQKKGEKRWSTYSLKS